MITNHDFILRGRCFCEEYSYIVIVIVRSIVICIMYILSNVVRKCITHANTELLGGATEKAKMCYQCNILTHNSYKTSGRVLCESCIRYVNPIGSISSRAKNTKRRIVSCMYELKY